MAAIAVFTESGTTARLVSKYRPKSGIYAFSRPHICNRLNLFWGVRPVVQETQCTVENMVDAAQSELLRLGRAKPGDVIGVVAGTQQASGSTNFMRLHVVTAGAIRAPRHRRTSKLASSQQ
jgi:pyruvate kinase